MKKMNAKRFVALVIALLLAVAAVTSLAEGADIATPTDLLPVEEVQTAAENTADVTVAEPTVEPTAVPTAEPTAEPTAAPTAEPTAEPTVEPTAEPIPETPANNAETVENTTVEPDAQPAVEPAQEPAETCAPEAKPTEGRLPEATAEPTAEPVALPQGTVTIRLRNQGELFFGDEVTLCAEVENVEGAYTITWQVKVGLDKWKDIETGLTYTFVLTEDNAALEYRAVLTLAE